MRTDGLHPTLKLPSPSEGGSSPVIPRKASRRLSWYSLTAMPSLKPLFTFGGSSLYKLPRVLQWFSGNIGFHHIHHLSSRIPNYNLEKCHRANPLFQSVKSVGLFSSFKSLTFRLWDEQRRKLVGFGGLKTLKR